jgi:hypothetical protein
MESEHVNNKWQTWWDSLPKHTQEYLNNQPLWHDKDVALFVSIALAVGFCLGYILGVK